MNNYREKYMTNINDLLSSCYIKYGNLIVSTFFIHIKPFYLQ
ncbi:hypothetical protein HMPREF9446_03007 [Bacteroides fluxus YIT 12057]|uniref:Uncharacterized protein n=1 Tax=Bacteroides fluxus YIT 12057 TaxID=763034 RepID=F3PW72_9BACE|nr:hypothetical protein HMPREF9446_03007 [Bacteroides fluxus YIT 12057]